jgi:hypothetical protein
LCVQERKLCSIQKIRSQLWFALYSIRLGKTSILQCPQHDKSNTAMTFIITQFVFNLDWKASVSNYLALRLELLKHTFCSKNTNIGIIFQLQKSNAV